MFGFIKIYYVREILNGRKIIFITLILKNVMQKKSEILKEFY